jgi:hypothetical protein
MEKICERCGKTFLCTLDINCWCMTVFINPKVEEYISNQFQDCICQNCIQEITAMLDKSN